MHNFTLFSPYRDIYMNLALEQHLARAIEPGRRILLFWINNSAVVFGRFQNPWAECRTELFASMGIVPARRYSGGGTVYHDPGNLNYSVISDRASLDFQGNLEIVAGALRRQGADIRIGTRRDIFTALNKISGSAFQLHRDFAIHHGTLLVNADLDAMHGLIGSSLNISDSKAVRSIPSPVVNIGDSTGIRDPVTWAELLLDGFSRSWGGFSDASPPVPDAHLLSVEANELADWNWVYGQTPSFVLNPLPESTCRLMVDRGRILSVIQEKNPYTEQAINTDLPFTHPVVEALTASLRKHDYSELRSIIKKLTETVTKEAYHVI